MEDLVGYLGVLTRVFICDVRIYANEPIVSRAPQKIELSSVVRQSDGYVGISARN